MATVAYLIFFLSNVGILAGYLFVGLVIIPKAHVHLARTKWGGGIFFVACALTHAELAFHALVQGSMDVDDLLSVHMVVIHLIQAVALWVFVSGLYVEFVNWGPWGNHWQKMLDDECDTSETSRSTPSN